MLVDGVSVGAGFFVQFDSALELLQAPRVTDAAQDFEGAASPQAHPADADANPVSKNRNDDVKGHD